MGWSGRSIMYHGTCADYSQSIQVGIDPGQGRVDSDFGLGFYATTAKDQAQAWARRRSRSRGREARRQSNAQSIAPSVVTLELNWAKIGGLRLLAFVLNTPASRFFEFIGLCRAQDEATRHSPMNQNFDLIIGPVAQYWGSFEDTHIFTGYDQYCFHTAQAVSALTVMAVEDC